MPQHSSEWAGMSDTRVWKGLTISCYGQAHRRAKHAHQLEREGGGREQGVEEMEPLVGIGLGLKEHRAEGGAAEKGCGRANIGQFPQHARDDVVLCAGTCRGGIENATKKKVGCEKM